MTNSSVRIRVIVCALALCLGYLGGQLAVANPSGSESDNAAYKVVTAERIFTAEEYEELLNEMSQQGWVFDHAIPGPDLVVFRRAD